ncbi:T9SS-dependent choice-of-anchor J family protein [Phaeodactylibacter luteus]|uniref:T9SS type A sorting domain-containing protein n=1 Tax=Phaeodactylibacter luteus TaxID=1564516 RepID=A0A5C6RVJ6_9BACT|nr:choice-of-anchor J domain-containing protein [Phaeodactylibacter luteus]TXB65580.1 T9SS type A sorting domain-containing protein [Phaeodactylibacter luteus]
MKGPIQLLIVLLLAAGSFSAQAQETIVYDFEDGLMPESFTLINRDMLVPNSPEDAGFADTAWMVIESGLLESFAALSLSWYVDDAGPADDWMILPKITVAEGSTLSWTAISTTSSGNFPDSYQVLINAGEPTFESFEANGAILLTVDPEESESPQMRDISLADYAGQDVHIAFRNITPSGDALLIDDITITEGILSSTPALAPDHFQLQVQPNPVQGQAIIQYTLEHSSPAQLIVRNINGQQVMQANLGQQGAGQQHVYWDTAGLAAGLYTITVQTAEAVGTIKAMVQP